MASILRLSAVHEAGHAAVARFLGIDVCDATIVPTKDFMAHVTVWEDAKRYAWQRLLVRVAGPLAEAIEELGRGRVNLKPDWLSQRCHDSRNAVAVASEFSFGTSPVPILNAAAVVCDQILALPHVWDAVMALAESLERQKTISGDLIAEICGAHFAARHSLVDLFGPLSPEYA